MVLKDAQPCPLKQPGNFNIYLFSADHEELKLALGMS